MFRRKKSLPKEGKFQKAGYEELSEAVEELDRITKMLVKRDLELLKTREQLEASLEELKKESLEHQEKAKELEKINKVMVGREAKMIELKNEVKKLKQELRSRS